MVGGKVLDSASFLERLHFLPQLLKIIKWLDWCFVGTDLCLCTVAALHLEEGECSFFFMLWTLQIKTVWGNTEKVIFVVIQKFQSCCICLYDKKHKKLMPDLQATVSLSSATWNIMQWEKNCITYFKIYYSCVWGFFKKIWNKKISFESDVIYMNDYWGKKKMQLVNVHLCQVQNRNNHF